ncbi:MAG: hypothetical protein ACMV1B_09390 [Prevotella sp.]
MTLTIPYKYSQIQLESKQNGDLKLELSDSDELVTSLFHNITYNMSYNDIIMAIGEHEFKAIMAYYLTEFDKED